jgi:predicted transcriptional regulator
LHFLGLFSQFFSTQKSFLPRLRDFFDETGVPLCVPLQSFKMFLINYSILYYGMLKQQYRSEMGIMGDILDVTANGGRDGIIISAISRKANLSHYAVLDKCEKLVEAGLVESIKNDRNRIFQITEKGLGFFQEFKRFQLLVESMNLRY